MNSGALTRSIINCARALGFNLCGVVHIKDLERAEELARFPEWLARGHAGEMKYLLDPRRRSPSQVLEGARSIVVCALNYNTSEPYSTNTPHEPGRGWISRYAWGDDYHDVVGKKLEVLVAALRAEIAEPFEARAYVDTGPVIERAAAHHAGLGWLGKNTCLIHPELGSWLFLGVVLTTLDLASSLGPAEAPPPDLCGNCTLCIDACPTGALVEPYVLDARRCISYLTIELRGSIPEDLRAPMGRHVFGCDICQDVCPYNRNAPTTRDPSFQPRACLPSGGHPERSEGSHPEERHSATRAGGTPAKHGDAQSLFSPRLEVLAALEEADFRKLFRGSAIKRTKWRGLVRNACVALGNSRLSPDDLSHKRIVSLLEKLAASSDDIIADNAQWALRQLRK